jgi:glycosyltransferase involved in cell wall biosynthesis
MRAFQRPPHAGLMRRGDPQPVTTLPLPPAASDRGDQDRAQLLEGISIVLPCHDEEANLPAMLQAADAAACRVARAYEVVVVDDGSADRTRAIASEWPSVRVVTHASNLGYGAAVRSGIEAARMPWVFLTDADRQFDLRELDDFAARAGDADAIVGRRAERADPLYRRVTADAWNALVRALFAIEVTDVDCAFKLIRRDLLDGIELRSGGAVISTELLARLAARGARIEEREVTHRPRAAGHQSGNHPRVVARAFVELYELRRALRR